MDGDASSPLEMGMAAHTSQVSSSHSNLALTKALARINSRISSWREWGEVLEAKGSVFLGEEQQQPKGGAKGVYIPEPKK